MACQVFWVEKIWFSSFWDKGGVSPALTIGIIQTVPARYVYPVILTATLEGLLVGLMRIVGG